MALQGAVVRPAPCCGKHQICEECAVRPLAVCGSLTLDQLPRLAAIAHGRRFAAGQTLFAEGETASDLFILTEGTLKLEKLLPDGRRQITGFLMPGDFLGLAVGGAYAYSAEAVTPVRVCRFARAQFLSLVEELPTLERALLGRAWNEIVSAQEHMLLLGRKTAPERTASFLLQLADRQGVVGGASVDLPMSRTDIADHLGLTIETVSRAFTRLRQLRLIVLPEPRRVKILQRDGLEAAAGGWHASPIAAQAR